MPFFGQKLQVSYSKLGQISNFSEGQLDDIQRTLCRDFVTEGCKSEYRFKHVTSKSFLQYASASASVHLNNLPDEMTLDSFKDLLREKDILSQVQIVEYKIFKIAIGGAKDDGSPKAFRQMMLV